MKRRQIRPQEATAPVFGVSEYRVLLKRELAARQLANPSYSQRAFARDLGLTPGRLNDILSGEQGLSAGSAFTVAKKMELSAEETNYFVDLVRAKHARSEAERVKARERLSQWQSNHNYRELQLSVLQIFSDWLAFAILEIIKTKNFQPKISWIAERLSVSEERVSTAIGNLERLELLKREQDGWKVLVGNTSVMKGVPSRAVKSFPRQAILRSIASLYRQELENREFQTLVMAFDRRRLPELKTKLRNFIREVDAEFGGGPNSTDVVCLASQLFLLSDGEPA